LGSREVIVLDTHVLLWADCDDRRLGRKARTMLERGWASGDVGVSATTFWEIGLLQARGRVQLPTSMRDWRAAVLAAGVLELPLDGTVAVRALELAGLHDDPADRFIVATALVHDAPLVTADERLLAWQHALERQDARK
jgi:PIN domain nuclease of toxin-antitoxin system